MRNIDKTIARGAVLIALSFGDGYIARITETDKQMLIPFSLILIAMGYIFLMIIFDCTDFFKEDDE